MLMQPVKRISEFLFWCLVTYGLLLLPWHGLMDAYRAGFRAVGDVLFHSVGDGGSVHFEKLSDGDRVRDTTLRLTNRTNGTRGSMDIRAAYIAYRPTAFLVALVLATPTPWSRRGWALLWGLVGVGLFVAFRIWLQVFDAMSNGDALSVYVLGPFWKGVLAAMVKVMVHASAMSYLAPACIWILVALRQGDWAVIAAEKKAPVRSKGRS